MLSQRRPFKVLNENQPGAVKRVQPSRAAKTSHKWLSLRGDREKDAEQNQDGSAAASDFGCCYLNSGEDDKENAFAIHRDTVESRFIAHPCQISSIKSKSEQPESKGQPHRLPLQALSVPTSKPFYRQPVQSVVAKQQCSRTFFPPIQSPQSQNQNELSISMETISETSLCCDYDDEEQKNSDSAFFSCTQGSTPSRQSQSECESQEIYATRGVVRGPVARIGQGADVLDEYFGDILLYMREAEEKYRPAIGYMQRQPEITSNMRTKLVDWLIEVQDEYKLENETVALAVTYVDRFLSQMSVTRSKLQLLGTTAMFVAAKYEEIYPPDADEFAYVTADTYATTEVILMERLLLKVLGTSLAVPTPNQFLGFLFHKSHTTVQFRTLAAYLTEITMLHDDFHKYLFSVLAASAIAVASFLARGYALPSNGRNIGDCHANLPKFTSKFTPCNLSPSIRHYMKDRHDEIYSCSTELYQRHRSMSSSAQQFVREKYSGKKQYRVALVPSVVAAQSHSQGVVGCEGVTRDDLLNVWLVD